VRGLQRRQDPLCRGQPPERSERLVVGRRYVLGTPRVAQVRVLGPDARMVETRRDRVRVGDLTVSVGEHA
jgi:hypothetical protein